MTPLPAPDLVPYIVAVVAAFRADASVQALVGQRTFTHVPQGTALPYVKLSLATRPFETKGSNGYEATLTIQFWSSVEDIAPSLRMRHALAVLLSRSEVGSSAGGQVIDTFFERDDSFIEPDGITHQLITLYRVLLSPQG